LVWWWSRARSSSRK